MSGYTAKSCPRCGHPLESIGAMDKESQHRAAHAAMHGLRTGSPLLIGAAAAAAVARKFWPRKLQCPSCGYSVRE